MTFTQRSNAKRRNVVNRIGLMRQSQRSARSGSNDWPKRENRRLVVYFVMFIAVLFVVGAVNEHFHGVPGDVISTALAAGIGAFIGALFYLWCLISVGLKFGVLKEGKATSLIMPSAWIVFFALWAALAYWIFKI